MSDWQDISTAPRDGTGIIVVDMTAEKPEPGFAAWVFDCWSCIDPEMAREEDAELFRSMQWVSPTHWQPLPELPILTEREGE